MRLASKNVYLCAACSPCFLSSLFMALKHLEVCSSSDKKGKTAHDHIIDRNGLSGGEDGGRQPENTRSSLLKQLQQVIWCHSLFDQYCSNSSLHPQ